MNDGSGSGAATDHEAGVAPEARDAVALALFLIAAALLALTPVLTRSAPPGRGWYLEPRNWPIVSLMFVLLPGAALTIDLMRRWAVAGDRSVVLRRILWAFRDLGGAFEYSFYFIVYLLAIGYLGFAVSTLVFGQVCLWRAGLRSARWVLANLAFAAVLVLGLRVGMGLWFPMAPIFHYLPDSITNSIGTYL